jgi:hypothetical protein
LCVSILNSVKNGRNLPYFPLEFLQQAAKEVQGGFKNGEKAKDFALKVADKFPGTMRVNCTQTVLSKLQPNSSLTDNGFYLNAVPLGVLANKYPQPHLQFDQNCDIHPNDGSWNLFDHQRNMKMPFQT